jgi:hypothetical protein
MKNNKWAIITAVLVFTGFYLFGLTKFFDYVINREVSVWIQIPTSLAVLIFSIWYIQYLVGKAIKFLTEKTENND